MRVVANQTTQRAATGDTAVPIKVDKGKPPGVTVFEIPTPVPVSDKPPSAGTLTPYWLWLHLVDQLQSSLR